MHGLELLMSFAFPRNLTGQYSTDWGEVLAAAVTIVLPVVLVFVLLQRRFIDGMTAGAVKS
jgi:raffinose/stachyose/melibiose transport system permease protein